MLLGVGAPPSKALRSRWLLFRPGLLAGIFFESCLGVVAGVFGFGVTEGVFGFCSGTGFGTCLGVVAAAFSCSRLGVLLSKALGVLASTAGFDKNPQSKERGITLDLGFSAFILRVPQWFRDLHPPE